MEIIIGGSCQGKLRYVLNETDIAENMVCDGEKQVLTQHIQTKVLYHTHLYIRRLMQAGMDVEASISAVVAGNPDIIIICDEVGSGVVPMDAFEREYREKVGRIMCRLTRQAERVVRVQCGIGMQIKP